MGGGGYTAQEGRGEEGGYTAQEGRWGEVGTRHRRAGGGQHMVLQYYGTMVLQSTEEPREYRAENTAAHFNH